NPGAGQYSCRSCYVDRAKVEEEEMKLEVEMAERMSAIEAYNKKKISKQRKENNDLKNMLIGTLVIILFLLLKVVDNMSPTC
uniref:Uncharacterized protein n=1 Tax=Oryza brachyantha TaxID=4533 RepID=J3LPX0_ORYBR